MDGRFMAELKIAAMNDIRESRNGCVGCGIADCFGNSKYEGKLEKGQKDAISKWQSYISKQISLESETN